MDATSVLYPLPDNKLPQVDLSPVILDHWKNEARDIVRDVLNNRQSWYFRFQDYQYLYKPIYAKNNTHACVRVIKRTKMMEFMSRGELNMTLGELTYGLHCENNAEQRAVYAQLYQDACLDGALIKLFKGRTPADPFHSVAVKWIAFRSPMNKIFHMRDFVYFEYCFTTTDADGRKVLIEFKKSKRLRPDQLHNHDLDITRGSMYVLNTYYVEEDHVVMHSRGRHDVSGNFPVWFAMSVMPIVFEGVHNHHGLVFTRTLADACMTVSSLADRRTGDATACRVCRKRFRFKFMRGKKWCRGCGHAVCRDCVTNVILYKNEIESAPRLPFGHERFCLRCLFHMREHLNHESVVDQPSCQFNLESEEASNFELSRITAAVHSMDDIFDQPARRSMNSMNESILSFSMVHFDGDQVHKCSSPQHTTRSSSLYFVERESFSQEFKAPIYKKSIDLIDMARVAADQAIMLRCIYQQECRKWRRQALTDRCSLDEMALSDLKL